MENITRDLVNRMFDNVLAGDTENAEEDLKSALSLKVADVLNARKQDIAQSIYSDTIEQEDEDSVEVENTEEQEVENDTTGTD